MDKISLLFLQALACGLERRQLEDPGLSPDEWKSLMKLSAEQYLLPIVFEACYPSMPKELEKEYRTKSLAWISLQTRKTDLFLKTYRDLAEYGIEPIVIKGVVCRDSYTLPDWRISSDEDLYVKQEDYMNFHAAMKHIGYKGMDPNFRSEHEVIYSMKELIVEGHWELFPQENHLWEQMNDLTEEISRRIRYLKIEGTRIRTPEPTDHMIYLLLHSMKHFTLAGVGVRQICDVIQWDKKYSIDWNRIREILEPLGAISFTEAVLDVGHKYFGMRIPDGWKTTDSTALLEDSLEGGVFGHNTEERIHSASITVADGINHNTVYNFVRTLFPTRKVMEINYPWISRSRLLLPVGWGVRFFKYARTIGKDNSPIRAAQIGKQRMKLMKQYGIFQRNSGNKPVSGSS